MRYSTLALATALLAPLSAQRPSSWATLQVPGGVQLGSLMQQGKFLAYQDNTTLHYFSAATRNWRSLILGTATTTRITNDWLLSFTPGFVTAVGAYRGIPDTITPSTSAFVVNPAAQRNDTVLVVQDGGAIHAFSAFTGRWSLRRVQPTAAVVVERNTVVVVDTNGAQAFSAFQGTWVNHPVSGTVTRVFAQGNVGGFEDAAGVHCFSAWSDRWSSHAGLAGATTHAHDNDLAIWSAGTNLLAYSSLTGTFATQVLPGILSTQTDERVAAVTGTGVFAFYSAVRGSWRLMPAGGAQILRLRSDTIVLQDATALHVFGSLSGNVATLAQQVINDASTETVAAAVVNGTGAVHVYSVFTDRWLPAPSDVKVNVLPSVASNGAVLESQTGHYAFSARTGRFVARAATGTSLAFVDPASSILSVVDAKAIAFFEPHRQVWLEHARQSPNPAGVTIWRTSAVALDGNVAVGFGVQHGAIETAVLGAPMVEVKANSECGRVVLSNALLGYAATGDITTYAQFPEFRRLQPLDSYLHVQVQTGTVALLAGLASAGAAATPVQLPFGELLLDLSTLQIFPMPGSGADGRTELVFQVPNDPNLRGFELALQAAVLPNGGTAYLSRLATARVQ